MPLPWFVWLLISITLTIIAYLILPRPKREKPDATKQLTSPTASAGKPISVVFGTLTITESNILAFADKRKRDTEVDA